MIVTTRIITILLVRYYCGHIVPIPARIAILMFTRLYLHIPFCRSKCPYCAFVSRETRTGTGDYAGLLLEEMRLAAKSPANQMPLKVLPKPQKNPLPLGGGGLGWGGNCHENTKLLLHPPPNPLPSREGELILNTFTRGSLESIYFGGGTPSLLEPPIRGNDH